MYLHIHYEKLIFPELFILHYFLSTYIHLHLLMFLSCLLFMYAMLVLRGPEGRIWLY